MNTLAPTPDVRQASTEDGTVLLDIKGGRFYGLNPTASAVWQALSDGHDIDRITRDLLARFNAPPERVRADITTLVAQLHERGLLQHATGSP